MSEVNIAVAAVCDLRAELGSVVGHVDSVHNAKYCRACGRGNVPILQKSPEVSSYRRQISCLVAVRATGALTSLNSLLLRAPFEDEAVLLKRIRLFID